MNAVKTGSIDMK